jgi:hypothetical protein
MEQLDRLWREYESFEVSRSEHLAKAKVCININTYMNAHYVCVSWQSSVLIAVPVS